MTTRYAIYFSPPADQPLGRLGHGWLGRDPAGELPPPRPEGLPAPLPDIVSSPAHYGFHATLKAPFEPADSATEDDLLEFARSVARHMEPVTLDDGLTVDELGHFLALVPAGGADGLDQLAGHVVRTFEPYRAPVSAFDLARRRLAALSERQEQNLVDWGYPYVFEEFRFHMTLTAELDEDARATWRTILTDGFAEIIGQPFTLDRICVFHQPARATPFRQIAQFALGTE
ncbi:MAG: DUF1045 domain-containing protein [Rhodospirillaceae bacterium]|nr:DUF1045 domain-containing protein [Rhodospirillaceae bacterium]MCA8932650.1 DUF1045 domain-containing protein [Rhodospirillaceae bacterium]